MPGIEFGFTTSAVIVLLLAAVAVGIASLFYRYTLPPVPRATRIVLVALRAASFFFILTLLFEPIMRLVFSSTQQPVLAVLLDNSKSMSIVDKAGNRAEQLNALVRDGELSGLSDRLALRYYTFGGKLNQRDAFSPEMLTLSEDATDISAALRTLATERERNNIQAALLVTDGAYNIGQNPIYQAEELAIPLYTIGIGDSTEQKDLLITKLLANDRVYNESPTVVDVTLKSSGYNGERVEVTLSEGTRELDRKTVTLADGTREYAVQFSYVPEGEGVKRYTVRVSSLPGELTTANNQRSFLVRVLKSKLRVLILAGSPSPDLSIIKQTLAEEKNITVRSFAQRSQGGFYEGPLQQTAVDSADCFVLIGFPVTSTEASTLNMLRSAIDQRKTPMLFVNGKMVDDTKLRMFASELPFTTVSTAPQEQYVFIQPSEAQKNHPVMKVSEDEASDAWTRLPPIFKTSGIYRAKPEATVLGVCKIQNIVTGEPLLLARNVSRHRSIAMLGYGIWRWRLMAQGTSGTERLLSTFLANSIRWLTTRDDDRPVKVTPTKDAFTQGEPVEFTGQVYDASAQPVENAQLRVTVERQGAQSELLLRSIGGGRYEGAFEGLPEGDYTFKAQANSDGANLGEDRGRFSVGGLDLEFQDTRMNASLLRQLAFRTGGRYLAPADLSGLAQDLAGRASFTPREVTRASSLELWNWLYTFGAIIVLLGLEWFIRKRRGML